MSQLFPEFETYRMTEPMEGDVVDFRDALEAPTAEQTEAVQTLFEQWIEQTGMDSIPGGEERVIFSINLPGTSTVVGMGFLYDMEITAAVVDCVTVTTDIFVYSQIPGVAQAVTGAAHGFEATPKTAGRPKMLVQIRGAS